ncbi:hypothetical protein IFM89_020870 [Coptis chinensis]|uniref:RanBP2-type domain-containing protein n=1 Tax=Coptis chinensis TaxID=261450 RepID=A0A835MFJ9_9MAGN|nr:hypothetical protein IFM89_020870 [Coptis chinensis]
MKELISTMAASRRFLFTSSFFRIHRNTLSTTTKTTSFSPFILKPLFTKTPSSISKTHVLLPLPFSFISKPLILKSYTTASEAIDTLTDNDGSSETTSFSYSHPWPEWVSFIEKLNSNGYFDKSLLPVEDNNEGGGGVEDDAVIGTTNRDLNKLRNASLTFSRDRFDIFRSLSREHIQTMVECGCPSLFRKAVNSAKRLRAFLKLDEGDVCSACNLRGSCDRAYGILKDSEAPARTVDIVRMLLIYALDPIVLSGEEKPHGREQIEASARKLLSELVELSETPPDPALPKPAINPPRVSQGMGREPSKDVEMKRGDWICPNCTFMNFARNIRCLECKADGPNRVNIDDIDKKKGDWTCPQCQFMNFARNTKCIRPHCGEPRPKRDLQPGEWECPKCDFLNYRRNKFCLKCSCDKPKDEVAEYEDIIWKRPR